MFVAILQLFISSVCIWASRVHSLRSGTRKGVKVMILWLTIWTVEKHEVLPVLFSTALPLLT